jgi:putative addiction module component (TIGR02574 family)
VAVPDLEQVRLEALRLSPGDRSDLVDELLASLSGDPDPQVAAAWDAEIQRRLAKLDSGTATFIEPAELIRRMRAQRGAD